MTSRLLRFLFASKLSLLAALLALFLFKKPLLRLIFPYKPSKSLQKSINQLSLVIHYDALFPRRLFVRNEIHLDFSNSFIRGKLLHRDGGIESAHSHYDPTTKTLIFLVRLGDSVCGHPQIIHGMLECAFAIIQSHFKLT